MKTAALLSTAFTFPYALMQPVLGTIGDFFGKTRLMNASLAIVVTTTLVCAFASNFTLLVTMRIVAGVLPVASFRSAWRSSAISCRCSAAGGDWPAARGGAHWKSDRRR